MTTSFPLSDTQLSKKLSWLLRHGAIKEGLPIEPDGYISLSAILRHPNYSTHYSLDIIKRLVANDAKQRYSLKRCGGSTNDFKIKANQGHSIASLDSEACLVRIQGADEVPVCVHGTYYRHWERIRSEGLRRMGRNHIHFATADNFSANTSGFRNNCQLLIYVDVRKAMSRGGMIFYRSANGVVLSAGIDGQIPKDYFKKVVDRKTKALLDI